LRVISAVILAPIVLGVIIKGGLVFYLMTLLLVSIMAWEWFRLCGFNVLNPVSIIFIIGVSGATTLTFVGSTKLATATLFFTTCLVFVLAFSSNRASAKWITSGVIAIGVTGLSLILVRESMGAWVLTVWFVVTVWMTDIFAYFGGRKFQGRKLAPQISPGKTWTGLAGGIVGAVAWSIGWSLCTGGRHIVTLALLGMVVAVLAQLGDLGVSRVKRQFGVKDTGSLIPGHGGLLDRADGIIGAAPVALMCVVISNGSMSFWT